MGCCSEGPRGPCTVVGRHPERCWRTTSSRRLRRPPPPPPPRAAVQGEGPWGAAPGRQDHPLRAVTASRHSGGKPRTHPWASEGSRGKPTGEAGVSLRGSWAHRRQQPTERSSSHSRVGGGGGVLLCTGGPEREPSGPGVRHPRVQCADTLSLPPVTGHSFGQHGPGLPLGGGRESHTPPLCWKDPEVVPACQGCAGLPGGQAGEDGGASGAAVGGERPPAAPRRADPPRVSLPAAAPVLSLPGLAAPRAAGAERPDEHTVCTRDVRPQVFPCCMFKRSWLPGLL